MFKMNQLIVGIFLFLSSLFSCQQKGDFQSMNVEDFDTLIQNEDIQRLDVRTLAEYSEGHIAKTININVMDILLPQWQTRYCRKTDRWLYIAVVANEARRLLLFWVRKAIKSLTSIRDLIPGRRMVRMLKNK